MSFDLDIDKLVEFNPVHRLTIARKHERYQRLGEKEADALTDEESTEMDALKREISPYGVAPNVAKIPNNTVCQTRRENWQDRPGVELNEKFDELLGKERFRIFELSRVLYRAESELNSYGDMHPARQHQAMEVKKLREQLWPYRKYDD